MSLKAKGKQRAVEQDLPVVASQTPSAGDEDAVEATPTSSEAPPPSSQPDQGALFPQSSQASTAEDIPEASTSTSPRIEPLQDMPSSQPCEMSLLFGGSNQLEAQESSPTSTPFSAQLQVQQQIIPLNRSPTAIISPASSWQQLEEMHNSPIRSYTNLPATQTTAATITTAAESSSTVIVPDSQEDERLQDATMDTSALTDISKLTDYANASLSEIMQMPFCSQESSVSEEADSSNNQSASESVLGGLSLDHQHQEKPLEGSKLASSSQESEVPPPKQIQIQRYLTVPRVIPLHGTLDEMHCSKCNHIEPLDRHLHILESGHSIHCPKCLESDFSRTALGERSRGVGVLKVSVVLYGEEHKQASRVGEIAEKDLLKAARPDILIVAGTTLRIPGVKKLVKELAKVIKQPIREAILDEEGNPTGEFTEREDTSKRVIFVNRDPPNPEKTWSDVFDTFVQGDAQAFARLVRQELQALRYPPAPQAVPPASVAAKTDEESMPQPLQTQTLLTNCWDVFKKGNAVQTNTAKPAGMLSMEEMLSASKPISLAQALGPAMPVQTSNISSSQALKAHQATQAPIAEVVTEAPKNEVTEKKGKAKAVSRPKKQKQPKQLVAKASTPQLSTASATVTKKSKPKRPPIKSVAQLQREIQAKQAAAEKAARIAAASAATAGAHAQPSSSNEDKKPQKEKTRPGWRGYAEVAEGEEIKPKYADLFASNTEDLIIEGSRRRRTSTVPPPAPARAQQPTPKIEATENTLLTPKVAEEAASSSITGNGSSASAYSPVKGSLWPESAHPSVASTPPSLDSDRDNMSDSDETASYKGEYEVEEVSTSQETTCISPSLSAEAVMNELPSSATQRAAHVTGTETMETTSSPVIVEDSIEQASSISTISSSQSPPVEYHQTSNKRARSETSSPFLLTTFNNVVKSASHAGPTSKRVKIEV